MARPAAALAMTPEQHTTLASIARSQTSPHREVQRARALIAASRGVANARIAADTGVSPTTVRAWRRQFEAEGLATWGTVKPGRGRKHTIPDSTIAEIVELTKSERPDGRRWSARTLAEHVGVSRSTVHRVWSSLGIGPTDDSGPRTPDPLLDQALGDVAGVYVDPPRQAVVVYAKESRNRLRPRRGSRATAAATTHGSAGDSEPEWLNDEVDALNRAIAPDSTSEGPERLLAFLQETERNVPARMQVHLVMDGASDHDHPAVLAWLSRRARFHVHVVPETSTWLSQVEKRVRHVADRRMRRGRPGEGEGDETGEQPYVWVSTADRVLSRVRRRRSAPGRSRSRDSQ